MYLVHLLDMVELVHLSNLVNFFNLENLVDVANLGKFWYTSAFNRYIQLRLVHLISFAGFVYIINNWIIFNILVYSIQLVHLVYFLRQVLDYFRSIWCSWYTWVHMVFLVNLVLLANLCTFGYIFVRSVFLILLCSYGTIDMRYM